MVLNYESGTKVKEIDEIHQDEISSIYVFKNGDRFLTGSVDGFLIEWNLMNFKKIKEIKTKRISSFEISPNEKTIYVIYGESKLIDMLNLEDETC